LPDSESGIFFAPGLDKVFADLPGGLFCRTRTVQMAIVREAKSTRSEPSSHARTQWVMLGERKPDFPRFAMPLNTDKIDDTALALLYLTLHDGYRAWKGFDWDVLNRLHQKGMIDNPVSKTKSVVFTAEGLERAKTLFEAMFKE
jgi:hypothetical protein